MSSGTMGKCSVSSLLSITLSLLVLIIFFTQQLGSFKSWLHSTWFSSLESLFLTLKKKKPSFYFRHNSTKLEQHKLSLMMAFEMNKPYIFLWSYCNH